MPRFTDTWVLNNTMYIYLQGGGACFCCPPQLFSAFSPDKEPVEALIRSLEDLNERDKERELRALKDVPWDDDMKGQVWGDRGLLRWKMKKEMAGYQAFLERLGAGDDVQFSSSENQNTVVNRLGNFCRDIMTPRQLHDIFQISRQDVIDILQTKYKICSFATVVFCAVAEQLEHFDATGLGIDAPNDASASCRSEADFENDIQFDQKRGFCIDVATIRGGDDDDYTINNLVLEHFLRRMVTLAGPTLLTYSNKNNNSSSEPSFHSDRRMIRLIIVKYWAEKIIERYTGDFDKCRPK